MLELGDDEEELHRNIGRQISSDDIDYLLLYGPLSKFIYEEALKTFEDEIFYFENKERLVNKMNYYKQGRYSLGKGFRSYTLGRLLVLSALPYN